LKGELEEAAGTYSPDGFLGKGAGGRGVLEGMLR
jgi:hypothetical protein